MNVNIKPGKYVLAVSGGVDSMVLLDLLCRKPGLQLIVAHFDHGIRRDSGKDNKLVRRVAMSHNMHYECEVAQLGSGVSENNARIARYDFLRRICQKHNADAIITAHHQDDLLETAIINLLRGTGWRGLSSLCSLPGLVRPLLGRPKSELVEYALQHGLVWREDSTNADDRHLRNYVRHRIVPKMTCKQRKSLLQIIVRQKDLTTLIDRETNVWLHNNLRTAEPSVALPRYPLIMLPSHVAHELLQQVLRRKSGKSMQRPQAERVLLFCKVAKSGKAFQINAEWQIRAVATDVIVVPRGCVVN
jgi:tRNA(Ile)-lysidine synthetase-like protein